MKEREKAICLFSGGLDSSTVLYWALREGYDVVALSIYYGQTHEKEIECSKHILAPLNIKQHTVRFNLAWGGSALTDKNIDIPKDRNDSVMASEIPATYVPARNTIFLSMATSLAEVENAGTILIGANAIDYSGYPDCRPDYLNAFEKVAELGTKRGIEGNPFKIAAPLLKLSKKEIVELAVALGVPLKKTWSCYVGGDRPCGKCDSCQLRAKGFEEAGVKDPALVDVISGNC